MFGHASELYRSIILQWYTKVEKIYESKTQDTCEQDKQEREKE